MRSKAGKLYFIIAVIIVLLSGCARTDEYDSTAFLMGTVVNERIFGSEEPERISVDVETAIKDLENEISWRLDSAPVALLNGNAGKKSVSFEDAQELFVPLQKLYRDTDGKFDPTVGKITTLWNIGTDDARVPAQEEIKDALAYVDGSQISIDGKLVSIGEGQFLDLGAVGKGYACDKAREMLEGSDAKGACISVGGSVLVYGEHDGNKEYKVAVRDPDKSVNDYIGILKVSDCVISTSGDYEHVLENDGVKYHHIIDPYTGYPVGYPELPELKSVTIICKSGLMSDALSTACFSLGLKDGMALAEKYGVGAVFITRNGDIHTTDGVKFEK